MLHYDTVIFDLDGTLLDTLEDLKNAVNHALGEMNFPARSLEEVRQFVGNGVAKLMERAVPAGTGPRETARALDLFKAYYEQHKMDTTAPYPGVMEMLKALKEKGCKLAVVSNKFDGAVKGLVSDYFPGLMDAAAGENEAGGVPKKPHGPSGGGGAEGGEGRLHRGFRRGHPDRPKFRPSLYLGDLGLPGQGFSHPARSHRLCGRPYGTGQPDL